MKKLLIILIVLFCWICSNGQTKTKYPLPYDTIIVMKPDGTGYLKAAKGNFADSLWHRIVLATNDSSKLAATTEWVKRQSFSGGAFPYVASIAALRASNIYTSATAANTLGYYTANDAGGASYYWDASSSGTDDGFLFIKPTAVSGNGRWRLLMSGYINAKWAGIKSDNATDIRAGLVKAITEANVGVNPVVIIPPGLYQCSDSILLNVGATSLIGSSAGSDLTLTTQISFQADKSGLVVLSPAIYPRIENILFIGGGTDTLRNGFRTNTHVLVNNVSVKTFPGKGFVIDTRISGNANTSRYNQLQADENIQYGIYIVGGESNNITFTNISSNTNGRANVYDASFLGNNWDNIHTQFAGARGGQTSIASRGGHYYIWEATEPGSGIEPTVTSGWQNYWYDLGTSFAVPSVVFAWDAGTKYFNGSAFAVVGPNGYNKITGLYTEAGQGPVIILGYGMMLGGDIGSDVFGSSVGWLSVTSPGQFESKADFIVRDANNSDVNYTAIRRTGNLETGNSVIGGGTYVQFGAWTDTTTKFTTANTPDFETFGFALPYLSGTLFNRPGTLNNFPIPMLYRTGMAVADSTNGSFRFINYATSETAIQVSYHAIGDVVYNIGPDPTIIGWKCTTEGIPGTFTVMSSGGGGAFWALTGTSTLTGGGATIDIGANTLSLTADDGAGNTNQQLQNGASWRVSSLFADGASARFELSEDHTYPFIQFNDGAISTRAFMTSHGWEGQAVDTSNYTGNSLPIRDWVLDHIANGSSGIGGSTGSTDNALIRANGTGGATVQSSGITVDDNNNIDLPWGSSTYIRSQFSTDYNEYITFDNVNRLLKVISKGNGTEGNISFAAQKGVGINIDNTSWDFEIASTDRSTSGINITYAAGLTSVPKPGTVSSSTILNGRGFGLTNGATLSSGYQPALGMGVAVSSTDPAIGVKNSGIGAAIAIEAGTFTMGTATPSSASALFEMVSTTQGLLLSRMTATQASAISSPADGLLIYVNSTNGTFTSIGFWGRVSGVWTQL